MPKIIPKEIEVSSIKKYPQLSDNQKRIIAGIVGVICWCIGFTIGLVTGFNPNLSSYIALSSVGWFYALMSAFFIGYATRTSYCCLCGILDDEKRYRYSVSQEKKKVDKNVQKGVKHRMKKRILSFILSLVMVIGIVPTSVFAEGDSNTDTGETNQQFQSFSDGSWWGSNRVGMRFSLYFTDFTNNDGVKVKINSKEEFLATEDQYNYIFIGKLEMYKDLRANDIDYFTNKTVFQRMIGGGLTLGERQQGVNMMSELGFRTDVKYSDIARTNERVTKGIANIYSFLENYALGNAKIVDDFKDKNTIFEVSLQNLYYNLAQIFMRGTILDWESPYNVRVINDMATNKDVSTEVLKEYATEIDGKWCPATDASLYYNKNDVLKIENADAILDYKIKMQEQEGIRKETHQKGIRYHTTYYCDDECSGHDECECYTIGETASSSYNNGYHDLTATFARYVTQKHDKLVVSPVVNVENGLTTLKYQLTDNLNVYPEVGMLFQKDNKDNYLEWTVGEENRQINPVVYQTLQHKVYVSAVSSGTSVATDSRAITNAQKLGEGNKQVIYKGSAIGNAFTLHQDSSKQSAALLTVKTYEVLRVLTFGHIL